MKRLLLIKYFFLIVNILLFAAILFFTKAIYNSDYDSYNLYLLGGGFGNPPTELLHLNHIMHPYLGIVIKNLFRVNSNVNWYSATLVVANFIACNIIFYQLLRMFQVFKAAMLYMCLFVVFECWILLQISFTNSSIVLGVAGTILLIVSTRDGPVKIFQLVGGIFILVFASLIRIHVLIPLIVIAIPFVFLIKSSNNKMGLLLAIAVTAMLIFWFNHLHVAYYSARINAWQVEENYRQSVYNYVNHPAGNPMKRGDSLMEAEISLLNKGLFIDTSFISRDKLRGIVNSTPHHRSISNFLFNNYWFFIENRIFFYSVLVFGLFIKLDKKTILVACSSLLICFAMVIYLFIYQKLPKYILPSLLFEFSILVLLFSDPHQHIKSVFNKLQLAALFSLMLWGIVRVYKINSANKRSNEYFKSVYKEIQMYPDTLFVVTDDEFPLGSFYIWDIPKKYKLKNLLYKPILFQNGYDEILKRFKFDSLKQLPEKSNVLFWGKRNPGLEKYYEQISGRTIFVSDTLTGFKSKVYTIKYEQGR